MARRPGRVAAAEAAAQNAGLEVSGADERPRLGPAYPPGGRNQKAGLAQDDIGADEFSVGSVTITGLALLGISTGLLMLMVVGLP